MAMSEYLRLETQSSGNTHKAKSLDLKAFCSFLCDITDDGKAMLFDVTRGSIEDFLQHELTVKAPSTVRRELATIKHFCRTMSETFHDFGSPARGVRAPRIDKTQPPRLTYEQKERLRNAAAEAVRPEIALRNMIIVELGLSNALRCSEIAGLQAKNMTDGRLDKFRGKGTRYSTMTMHKRVRLLVEQYSDLREALITQRYPSYPELSDKEKLAFPYLVSFAGAKLSEPKSFALNPKTIWHIFNLAGEKAGFKMHPHLARHTAIKDFYVASERDMYQTKDFARHIDVNTTGIYAGSTMETISETMEAM